MYIAGVSLSSEEDKFLLKCSLMLNMREVENTINCHYYYTKSKFLSNIFSYSRIYIF